MKNTNEGETADPNHPGVILHPEHINAPAIGTLTINSYANGTADLSFHMPTAKEQMANDLKSWTTVGGATGNVMQLTGGALTIFGGSEVGVPLMVAGNRLSLTSTLTNAAIDYAAGNKKDAYITVGTAIASTAVSNLVQLPVPKETLTVPGKKLLSLVASKASDKMVADIKKHTLKVEVSTDLNYKIDPPPQNK